MSANVETMMYATVFNIRGESFRGKRLETVALQTGHTNALVSTEKPVI